MSRVRRQELDIAQLTRVLTDDQARRDLRLYFGVGFGNGQLPPYTGGRFELLYGGGDRVDVCDRFTASDIVALRLLSVELPAWVALDLLEGGLGAGAGTFLEQIPVSVNLWDADAEKLIEKGS